MNRTAAGPGAAKGLAVRDVVVRYDAPHRRERPGAGPGSGRPGADRAGRPAVAGVSLDVDPGEIVALLGPSGCGKSSLLRAVAGLEPLAGGTVAWSGQDLADVPVHRRGFVLLFQDGQLFAHRDVAGNIAYGLAGKDRRGAARPRGRRAERQAVAARVDELLSLVGLPGYEHRPIATLSGGERQRVALARALAPSPRLLLLDEPLSALDRELRERLAAEIRAVLRTTGTTAILVTHDHDEAATLADRVAVMSEGRLLQVGIPATLWRRPASVEVARFLGYQAFVSAEDAGWAEEGGDGASDGGGGARGEEEGGDGASDDGASDGDGDGGRLVAIGPRGLRLAERSGAGELGGLRPGEWPATVVATTFRRGVTEASVDVDLPAGTCRMTVAAPDAAPGSRRGFGLSHAPAQGERVVVAIDPSGCAMVGGTARTRSAGEPPR